MPCQTEKLKPICISKALICDGTPDCPNGEDEENCPVDATVMNLVGKAQLCDGYLDRRDGTDETNCPYLKESPRFETSECTFDSNSTVCLKIWIFD